MTTDTTTPADAPAEAPETTTAPETDTVDTTTADDDADADTATQDDEATPASREAARYRKRLRAVESERDQLAARLEHLQRGEAQRIAADHLADGADLWRDGATIAELVDDDGNLDADRVAELAAGLVAAHPHWSRRAKPKALNTGPGMASGATSPAVQSTPSWSTILRGGR